MHQPKSTKQELPWWLYAILSGICFVSALLTILNIFDFAPKPGVQRGLLIILTGLHEIAGPIGPALGFVAIGVAFAFVTRSSYTKNT